MSTTGKAMKPAWDKLMKQYDGHASILVADVEPLGWGTWPVRCCMVLLAWKPWLVMAGLGGCMAFSASPLFQNYRGELGWCH